MFSFSEKIKTNKKLVIAIGVFFVLILGIAGYLAWNKGKFSKTDYTIPGVPYYGIYNHTGKAAGINLNDTTGVVVSILEYWNPDKSDFGKINNFFGNDTRKGLYITNKRVEQFFGETGGYGVKEERLEIKDLKKYINPGTRTPLFLFLPVSDDQPIEVTYHPATLLIGINEPQGKLIFHDFWLGNNYEMTFDEFNKRWERMSPEERNMYLVVQPTGLESKLKEVKNRTNLPYPARTETMKMTEQIFKNHSIAVGAMYGHLSDLAISYFQKVQNDPNFKEYFPPLLKVITWYNLASAYSDKNDFDNAFKYANMAIEANHNMDDPYKDWPGYEHPGRGDGYGGVLSNPYVVLGNIYFKQTDFEKAKESYQQALAIYPGNREAPDGLQTVEQELEKKQ